MHDILNKFGKKHNIIDKKKEEGLVRNLEAYVDGRNVRISFDIFAKRGPVCVTKV